MYFLRKDITFNVNKNMLPQLRIPVSHGHVLDKPITQSDSRGMENNSESCGSIKFYAFLN